MGCMDYIMHQQVACLEGLSFFPIAISAFYTLSSEISKEFLTVFIFCSLYIFGSKSLKPYGKRQISPVHKSSIEFCNFSTNAIAISYVFM